jgi:hypothetical protein
LTLAGRVKVPPHGAIAMNIKLKDILATEDNGEWRISLSKLLGGKKIKDIRGILTSAFGDVTFQVTELVFEDGTDMEFEGEHDCPHLVDYASSRQPNFDDKTLQGLYEEYAGVHVYDDSEEDED